MDPTIVRARPTPPARHLAPRWPRCFFSKFIHETSASSSCLWFAAPSSSIPLTTTRAGLTTLRIIVVSSIHRKTCLWRHQQNSPPSSTSLQRKVDLTIGCTSVDGTVHGSSTWTPSRLGLCSRAMGLQMAPSIFCERLSTDTFRCFAHILSPSFFPLPLALPPPLFSSLFYSQCHTADHDVLTKLGWKKIADVSVDDEVLTLATRTSDQVCQRQSLVWRY